MPEAPATPYLRPAFLTAGLSVALGIAVSGTLTLLAQIGGDASVAELLRTSVRGWLVAHGSGLEVEGTSVGLVPLGAAALCVVVVAVAARWIAADPIEELGPFAATVAGSCGAIAAVLSAVTNTGEIHTSVVRAAFGAFAIGGIGSAVGAAMRHGGAGTSWTEMLWFTDRADVRAVVRGAWWGVAALLGSAATLVVVLLTLQVDRAADLWALLDPGFGGGLVLAGICVLSVPTLVLWATSVLLGPGFMLGTDTSVDLSGSQLGAVPGFPPLAALPPPGEFPGWVFVLGLVPLLAGVVAGLRTDPAPVTSTTSTLEQPAGSSDRALLDRLILGAAAGAMAGLVVGLAVSVSGGGIGPGRMADAGPPLLTPLLVAVPVLAAGGALGAVLAHYRGTRAPQPTERSPDRSTRGPRLRWWHQSPGSDRRDDGVDEKGADGKGAAGKGPGDGA